jgi:hypothetical protein
MELTEALYNEMVGHYGARLANPEVFPATFKYQFKLFLYWKANNDNSNRSEETV